MIRKLDLVFLCLLLLSPAITVLAVTTKLIPTTDSAEDSAPPDAPPSALITTGITIVDDTGRIAGYVGTDAKGQGFFLAFSGKSRTDAECQAVIDELKSKVWEAWPPSLWPGCQLLKP
jgi:hypothetical protein